MLTAQVFIADPDDPRTWHPVVVPSVALESIGVVVGSALPTDQVWYPSDLPGEYTTAITDVERATLVQEGAIARQHEPRPLIFVELEVE